MSKLRFPVGAAKMSKFTDLKALIANRTRWSSTYVMLQRYLEIRQHISKIAIPGIVKLMPTPTEDYEVELLCSKLAYLDSVT